MNLNHDFKISFSVGTSRMSRKWSTLTMLWSNFAEMCRDVRRTRETMAEYARMSRAEQGNVKDVGGFVGAEIDGERKGANVRARTMVTLDMDFGEEGTDLEALVRERCGCAAVGYSTHKHKSGAPRMRLCLAPDRPMSRAEYEPVSRHWAAKLGIGLFDHTTHDLNRLFYWPSASADAPFEFFVVDAEPFSVDAVLASYEDWRDSAQWPVSPREETVVRKMVEKAGDSLGKKGIVGAFCRAYSIEGAIAAFLSDVYLPTKQPGRYTYAGGHVAGGLVCYDGKYAYSHHDSDPAGDGHIYNAFDLVRVHRFGNLDDGQAKDPTKMASYKAMCEFAAADSRTAKLLYSERMSAAAADFAGIGTAEDGTSGGGGPDAPDWVGELEYDRKTDGYKASMANLRLIMLNDPHFRNVRYDAFAQRERFRERGGIFAGTHAPHDVDDTSLARMCAYLAKAYKIELGMQGLCDKMLAQTAADRSYNPVEEFVRAEQWDGVPRLDTVLIDYLGADDTPLVRAMTRKALTAAVARAVSADEHSGEGVKFDHMLVLLGGQGVGKSTLVETIAGRWRGSVSLDAGHKEQCESIQAAWIVEAPEMGGMQRGDTDKIKDLISRRSDDFRKAYGRTYDKVARHCIFIGSTNNEYFLKDTTGDRRFWVVQCAGALDPVYVWAPRLRKAVPQIWAEAYHYYKEGEPLYLDEDMERKAAAVAAAHNEAEDDPLREYLAEWLDRPLPARWDMLTRQQRSEYMRGILILDDEGTEPRGEVTITEILTNCNYPGIQKYSPKRIGQILRSLGWEQKRARKSVTLCADEKCHTPEKKCHSSKKVSRFYVRGEARPD